MKHCDRPVTQHYAAFPPALAELCILAGTSEHGVCAECGAPWTRVITSKRVLDGEHEVTGSFSLNGDVRGSGPEGVGHWRYSTHREQNGWEPTCACDAEVVPATVLDPFSGSATTLLTARTLGRRSIGIELREAYARMSERRLAQLSLLSEGSRSRPDSPSTRPASDTIGTASRGSQARESASNDEE